jgi:PAP2 superfamily
MGVFEPLGDGFHDAWLAVLALLGGRLARHERAERAGRAALAAVVLAGLGSALLTFILQMPRPDTDAETYRFPWGHASPAFALSAVLGHAFPTWAPLLSLAAIVAGVARVYHRTHVLLDVAVGALLGTGTGIVLARGLLGPAPAARAPIAWGLGLAAVMVAVPLIAFFAAYERALAAHQPTDAGPVGASPGIVLVQFGTKESRPRLGHGWSGDETWKGRFPMIWAEGLEAHVVLPELPAVDHRFRLHLLPFIAPRRPPCQSVAITVNGQPVAALRLDTGWRWYEIRVPARALTAGPNEVRFRFARADRPRDYGRSADLRALSVAFAALEAVRAGPGEREGAFAPSGTR